MKLKFVAMAFAVTLAAGPARAQDNWFLSCDGFPTPGRRFDGMTGQSNLWGANMGDPDRARLNLGRAGIQSCNESLGDSRLLPAYNLRRASLLQARALHRLATNDNAGALADLDASDSALGDDVLGRRSVGLATGLLRAYVLLLSGDRQAAAQRAEAVLAARPWEPNLALAAVRIQLAARGDWDAYQAHLRDLSRNNPRLIAMLFALAVARGAFDEAVRLYPQIAFEVPRQRGGYVIQGLLITRVDTIAHQLEAQGAYAYALAATGAHDQAREQIADARGTLAQLMAPPIPPEGRTNPTDDQEREHDAFVDLGRGVGVSLERFERLIRLRIQVADGNVQAVVAELQSSPAGLDGAALDLVRAISATGEPMRRELAPVIAEGERRIANDMDGFRLLPLSELVRLLPEPETQERTPAFTRGSNSILLGEREGFGSRRSESEGAQTLTYTSGRGSLATANELVLLRAAQLARENGHRGFIVVNHQETTRSIANTYFGTEISRQPNGQAVEIDVVFVDPAHLPPAYAAAPWRVIDADAVWNALGPIYLRQASSPAH